MASIEDRAFVIDVNLIKKTVDFFRYNPNHPRPLACFLSHVHSDHLAGLETLKAPLYVPILSRLSQGRINLLIVHVSD